MGELIIARTVKEVRQQVSAWRKEGLTVGLVPTMGYLHEGHASLVVPVKRIYFYIHHEIFN